MSSGIDDGKVGFLLTVLAMLVLVGTLAMLATTGASDKLLSLMFASIIVAAAGHFMLGGGEFRKKMIADKKRRREKK